MKREKRDLDREPEKDSGESEPIQIARQHIRAFPKLGQAGEIECSPREINSEKRQQHGYAAEKSVKKEFRSRPFTIFAPPDFYQEERRDQAHLIEEKPENEILRG